MGKKIFLGAIHWQDSTTVQTLDELRMCGTANWWAGLFCGGLPLVARRESDTS